MDQPLTYQVQQLLSLHKISFDKAELSFQIQSHPSFPSLHAVTGVLDHFGIDNLALDVPNTESVYHQLPTICLVQVVTQEGKQFAILIKKENVAQLIYSSKNRKTFSIPQFLEMFTRIIVAIEKPENNTETSSKITFFSTGMYVVLGILLSSMLFFSDIKFLEAVYLILSLLGFVISISIVKQQLGIQSSIGEAFCSGTDISKDCNTVINSNGSKIVGILSLSDASLVYFSTIIISTVFAILSGSTFVYLFALSILATPIVLYSIYYQYFHTNSWCPLCLVIAGTLFIQGALAGFFISEIYPIHIEISSILFLITAGLGSSLIWNMLSSKIDMLIELKQIKIDYYKFKRNFDLFQTALQKSPRLDTTTTNTSEIVFGNRNAPLSIVLVTSPFCGHCKPVHNQIEEILKKYNDKVAITIRFAVSTKDKDGILFKITSRLTEIYHIKGSDTCLKAMHDIYNEIDEDVWFSTWGHCENVQLYIDTLDAQNAWCLCNSINFTPEILINGRSFPKEYERKDLLLFIEDLATSLSEEELIPNMI